MKKLSVLLFATVLTIGVVRCTTTEKREVPPGPRVSIMTYNVENLFDTKHDTGKDDYTFLPLAAKNTPEAKAECNKNDSDYRRKECLETDWNEDVLNKKLDRVSDVIQQINDGRGPDIQILVEVENKNVLEMLRGRLGKSDYKTSILLEGPDNRGIDQAILSRFPEWDSAKYHIIPYKPKAKEDEGRATRTRGILEARLTLPDGQKVSVFAIHFPSQGNPRYLREQAIEFLGKLMKGVPKDVLAIAGGDFNITPPDDKEAGLYSDANKGAASYSIVTHLIGCKKCEGTNYYHRSTQWSFLDALLFSKDMQPGSGAAGWKVDPESIRIPNDSKYQVNKYGSPARFDESSATGVSDHWPMYAEIYKPIVSSLATPAPLK